MPKDHKELWQNCLQYISRSIPAEQFNVWFRDVRSLGFDGGKLRLLLPSAFFGEYIDQHYGQVMIDAIRGVYGPGIEIFYNYYMQRDEPTTVIEVNGEPVTDGKRAGDRNSMFDKVKLPVLSPRLHRRYNFANYFESDSNRMAVSVAKSVADHPGNSTFNPLFVFGPTGVGKTHLVQAIGLRQLDNDPDYRVVYVTAREFMTHYTQSYMRGETNQFFEYYQSVNTLIVDDVQDLSGKTKAATQNTFYHIFNHLYLNNRQIVLSSDRSPADMDGFEDRLLGRFKCGMTVSMDKPDEKLRRDVLRRKSQQDGIALDDEVVEYIAGVVTESVRELEGILLSLVAHSTLLGRPIDMDLTRRVVRNSIRNTRKKVNFEIVVREVCAYYKLDPDVLFTKSRKREISDARQVVMFLTKKLTELPLTNIGRQLGRSHATVIYALNSLQERIAIDRQLRDDLEAIEQAIAKGV